MRRTCNSRYQLSASADGDAQKLKAESRQLRAEKKKQNYGD
jgi:hypothetical protein